MKKKIFIGIGIFAIVLLMIIINLNKAGKESSGVSFGGKKTHEVEVKTLALIPIESTVIVTGSVEEVNKKEIIIPSQTSILKWLVNKGDRVKKGDQLLEVDMSYLEEELNQLYISRDQQVLQLNKTKQLYEREGGSGAQIALELATINLESAKSYYESQSKLHSNNVKLFNEGIISQSELDMSAEKLKDAEEQLRIAELNLTKSSTEATDNKSSLAVDYQIQQKRLEEINLSIESVNKKMDKLNEAIISPLDGILTDIVVEEGYFVNAMQSVGTVVDPSALKVVTDIREYDFKKIALGQKAELTGDAIKEDAIITAKISYIDPIAKEVINGTSKETAINVELLIEEGLEYLKPGFTVDCEITTASKDDAIVASYDMFKEDKDGSKYVFVVDENNLLRKQPVKLGIISDFNAEVIEGLKVGDKVVVNPSLVLQEGSKVQVKELEE